MSQWDKLLDKLNNLSNDLRFEELEKILNYYGYIGTFPAKGSSHCVFRKDNETNIVIPVHKPIKRIYIKKVREIVEKEKTKI